MKSCYKDTLSTHPNHKSRYLSQSMYQHHSRWKQLTWISKNIGVSVIMSHNNNSSQKSYNHNILQNIELGWSDPSTIQQICWTLKSSYCLVPLTIKAPKTKNYVKTLQAMSKDVMPFHKYSLSTKNFQNGKVVSLSHTQIHIRNRKNYHNSIVKPVVEPPITICYRKI